MRLLENKETNYLKDMTVVDEDQETMFNLIATLKPLGIREDNTPFDLEFPTRNQLKCFLAKQITK